MNFLNYISDYQPGALEVRVYTMNISPEFPMFIPKASYIKIIRAGRAKKANPMARYWNYLVFYSTVLAQLASWMPKTVMYYETLSALPALLYKKLFNRRSQLVIHYHEYTSRQEYKKGMALNKWGHRLEKKAYHFAKWISHTNADRMRLFLEDNKGILAHTAFVLPNYPPKSWIKETLSSSLHVPVRFVYVGALSMHTMYTAAFASWIISLQGRATWDIYSDNVTKEAKSFLHSTDVSIINFRGPVNYFSLPKVLTNYDIGIILYKGHIPNYIFNAPNKLFEYCACGLDTWFPKTMQSAMPYITRSSYPKVVPVDFEELHDEDLEKLGSRKGLVYKSSSFYYEKVFGSLVKDGIGLVDINNNQDFSQS